MTQLDLIRDKLNEDKFVSRNWCLKRYITRLAAIIAILKKEGFNLVGRMEGNDYIYSIGTSSELVQEFREILAKDREDDKIETQSTLL